MSALSATPGHTLPSGSVSGGRGALPASNEGYYCPQCLHTVPGAALRPQRHRQQGITSTLLLCPACRLVLDSVVEVA